MEETIPLESLLMLVDEMAPAGSADLVALCVDALGLGERDELTQAEFLAVLGQLTRYSQRLVRDPAEAPGATEAQRAHMAALLEAVATHALPVLQDEA